ncbi:hypothetical protein [Actinophytocola sp.]|uniref:hypothetical protein n=1 Tax=Actinophytocola sp. TaxID=1872138 RepID=UPI002D7E2163|nr:hypothetical protein [Actinophytocola sp.]HET9143461.1 hypothetical protein [Actinophytocola sp.]
MKISRIRRLLNRLLRRRTAAGAGSGGEGGPAAGGAGVREPRRPLPKGPNSMAGAAARPAPSQVVTLPDPRR